MDSYHYQHRTNNRLIEEENFNFDPLEGTLTQDGDSAVIELGHRSVLDLVLEVTAVSDSDTLDAVFEGSDDGVNNWYTVHTFTQVTADPDTQRATVPCPKFGKMAYNVTGSDVSIATTCRAKAR